MPIVGPSGCGTSTLLNLVVGLVGTLIYDPALILMLGYLINYNTSLFSTTGALGGSSSSPPW